MFNDVSNELAMFEWTCFEMKKEKEKRKCYFQIDKSQIHTQLVLTKVFMFC